MTLSLIDRLPVATRPRQLERLSDNAVKRKYTNGLPLVADPAFARANRAWVGRLAWLGIIIEEVWPTATATSMQFGFPTAAITPVVTADPLVGGATPATFTMPKDGSLTAVTYAAASLPAPWTADALGTDTKGGAIVEIQNRLAPATGGAGVDQAVAASAQVTLTGALLPYPFLPAAEYIWQQTAGTVVAAFAALTADQRAQRVVGPFNIGAAGTRTFTLLTYARNGLFTSDAMDVVVT